MTEKVNYTWSQCFVAGCCGVNTTHGMCRTHYSMLKNTGTLTPIVINPLWITSKSKHGSNNKKCQIDNCINSACIKGLCRTHNLQHRSQVKSMVQIGTCRSEGCQKETYLKGFCSTHYAEQARRNKGIPVRTYGTRGCSFQGCTEKHKAHGLCAYHYSIDKVIINQRSGRNKENYKKKREDPDFIRKRMLRHAKSRAEKRGLEFTISLEDIPKIPGTCPLLLISIRLCTGVADKDFSPSLDRKDPTKGYIPGNIWIISWRANRIKTDASVQEIKLLSDNLQKYCSK